MEENISLTQMLEAREYRAHLQQKLLSQYQMPLISFTMNIAGPVKNSPLIRRGFNMGKFLLEGQLARYHAQLLHMEEIDAATGCEAFYVVNMNPEHLKAIACRIEDETDAGRLFDIDILMPDGSKLDRPNPRPCLICSLPAKDCARSRRHSVAELQQATTHLLNQAVSRWDAETAANLAVRSLLYEVCATPKPGLVDRMNNGSHTDMDIYTFMSSTSVLWPYFFKCVELGQKTASLMPSETLNRLRMPGMLAESNMLNATGNVNTHKGAIFSMGILCGALGRLERESWKEPALVLSEISAMTAGTILREMSGLTLESSRTTGERLYCLYGITGARGDAEHGYPAVLQYGLPTLERCLAEGRSIDDSSCAALLSILAHTTDSNMVCRGGFETAKEKAAELNRLLSENPCPERFILEELDRAYIKENLSPGGSADLLALTWMLHFLKEPDCGTSKLEVENPEQNSSSNIH